MASEQLPCGCRRGGILWRCPEADRLWQESQRLYNVRGGTYDEWVTAWLAAQREYERHFERKGESK